MKRSCALALMPIVLVGCGSGSRLRTAIDSGQDAASDAGLDAAADSGSDAAVDAGPDASAIEKRMFVTEARQNADYGGIEGADQLCATEAAAAELSGEYKAWLSTIASSVVDRLVRHNGPYVLVDGTRIANNWRDLIDGSIFTPINLDANGGVHNSDVWTGTLANGTSNLNDDCEGFTSGSGGTGQCGSSPSTDEAWTENIEPGCATQLHLYCVEQ